MNRIAPGAVLFGLAVLIATPSQAADAANGRMLFQQQCGACHDAGPGDGDGGIGPSLKGVIGREVAGDPAYAYSEALAAQKGAWTEASLAAFLEDPSKVAPGTSMSIQVSDPKERADLAAYLATVKAKP